MIASSGWADQRPVDVDVMTCMVKPKQVIELGSAVFGVWDKLMVDWSDAVKEGQIVGKLNTSVEESQLALDRFRASNTTQVEAAQIDLGWNKRELERRQKLAGNMFAKINDIDESLTKVEQDKIAIEKAKADLKTAELEAARSEAQYNLKLLRSPVNGVVSEIKLHPGEFIYETTPIMTIAQVDPLSVDLVMPASRYRAVRSGMAAEIHLLPPVAATIKVKVDRVDPIIDVASDTFRVRLLLPNPDYAVPAGVRCTARILDASDD